MQRPCDQTISQTPEHSITIIIIIIIMHEILLCMDLLHLNP